MKFLNPDTMDSLSPSAFKNRWPFPHQEIVGMLSEEGFTQLSNEFPSLNLFSYHQGLERGYSQRPHDRYYLAYRDSKYAHQEGEKAASDEDLPESWVAFIQELTRDSSYRTLLQTLFEVEDWKVRFAWHVGQKGNEVSPHLDNVEKIGTHIFYFNTERDWDSSWGGELVVLGGKMVEKGNPDFEDFATATNISNMNNRSFLFKNTPDAWHGVRSLKCPQGKYRKLFNVIYEAAEK